MQINPNNLSMGERIRVRQLLRAKAGAVTVREAREWMAPTGAAFVVQIVGMTVLALGMGLVFLPFLLVALIIPVWLPLRQRAAQKRWLTLLPREQDAEQMTMM